VAEAQLGTGGFGIVQVWTNKVTKQSVALKRCKFGSDVSLTTRHKAQWSQECDIMLRLDHANVVKCMVTPDGLDPGTEDLPTLCMEYCSAGDLRRSLNKSDNCRGLPEAEVLAILNDTGMALAYLHNRRIMHRDLKPENIVLKPSESRIIYKLIDLGYAKELGVSSMAQSFVGTLQYVAPELFLGHDYTRSVDYWSLGLLCHEIVTGQRPFLPNMSPGKWIDHVENKKYEDISIEQALDGSIVFSGHLAVESQVCRPLAAKIEVWLRCLIDWRPDVRGKDSNGKVIVFDQLQEILIQKIICVFSVLQSRKFYYAITEETTVSHLQSLITKDTGIRPDSHLLLSSRATPLLPHYNLHQFLEGLDPARPLYLFTRQQPRNRVSDHVRGVDLRIPVLVQSFLKDTRKNLEDYHQKKMFSHGYHFISQEVDLYRSLITGLHTLLLYLLGQNKGVNKSSQALKSNCDKIEARHELFRESMHHDLTKYQAQAQRKDRITSKRMVEAWMKAEADLSAKIEEVSTRVTLIADNTKKVNLCMLQSQKSKLCSSSAVDTSLEEIEKKSLKLYDNLRRVKASARTDCTAKDIAQVVVKFLKKRDSLLQEFYTELFQLLECNFELDDLMSGEQMLENDLNEVNVLVSKYQQRRQNDVWTLLAEAIKYTPRDPQSPPVNSLSFGQSPTIKLSTDESEKVQQENQSLRIAFQQTLDETLTQVESSKLNWDALKLQ